MNDDFTKKRRILRKRSGWREQTVTCANSTRQKDFELNLEAGFLVDVKFRERSQLELGFHPSKTFYQSSN